MVGLESSMEQAQAAKKVKSPEVAAAERKRQEKFMAMLRGRKAPQPKGAKAVTKAAPKAKPKPKMKAKKAKSKPKMKAKAKSKKKKR